MNVCSSDNATKKKTSHKLTNICLAFNIMIDTMNVSKRSIKTVSQLDCCQCHKCLYNLSVC